MSLLAVRLCATAGYALQTLPNPLERVPWLTCAIRRAGCSFMFSVHRKACQDCRVPVYTGAPFHCGSIWQGLVPFSSKHMLFLTLLLLLLCRNQQPFPLLSVHAALL